MIARIYVEGGGNKSLDIRLRKDFNKLLKNAGLKRMPRLNAGGSRNSTFDDFKTAHAASRPGDYVGMLVDSEDPVADVGRTWEHLKSRDNWDKPAGTVDEQVLLMVTCMETWIVADRVALRQHYGQKLQENALPPLNDLEKRDRHDLQEKLIHATRECSNAYAKGKHSFDVLGVLDPATLESLPSFARAVKILREKLK